MLISSIRNENLKFVYRNNKTYKQVSFKGLNCSVDFNEYDKINAANQYFKQYMISPNLQNKDKPNYDKILSNLNLDNDFNEDLLDKNKQFFKSLYGVDFNVDNAQYLKDLYLNEIKNKKYLVLKNINHKYFKEKIKHYKEAFPTLKSINYKNIHALNYFNLLPEKNINSSISNIYIDKYNLFNEHELKNITNCNIVRIPNNIPNNSFIDFVNKQLLETKKHYQEKNQNTIIIIDNLYKYTNENPKNLEFIKNIINNSQKDSLNEYYRTFLLKETNYMPQSISLFSLYSTPFIYGKQNAQILNEIIYPAKNNNFNLKKIFILTGDYKTTTQKLLNISNVLPNQTITLPSNTNVHNFSENLLSIINKAKEDYCNTEKKTLIILNNPYIFDLTPKNKQLLNQILNDRNQSYSLILNNYIPQNLKREDNINNTTIISFPKASEDHIKNLFKLQIEKLQSDLDKDFNLRNQKIENYSDLVSSFNLETIQGILSNTSNLYLKSGKDNFEEILLEEITKNIL